MSVKLRARALTVKVVSLSVVLLRFYASLTMFAAFAVVEYRFDRNDGHFLTSHISKNSVFILSKKLTLVQERVVKQSQ